MRIVVHIILFELVKVIGFGGVSSTIFDFMLYIFAAPFPP